MTVPFGASQPGNRADSGHSDPFPRSTCVAASSKIRGRRFRMRTWDKRAFPIVLFGLASAMGGWWLGEDARRHLLGVGWVEPMSVLGIAAFGWRLGGPGRWSRLTAITVLLGLFVGALLMGKREAGNAFNDCVSRGEEVRRALTRYRDQHGEYPTQLSKIEARARCGRRCCGVTCWSTRGEAPDTA
jgi:hypothetical protein